MEFKLYFRTIFFPKSNTIITTGKGKEHIEDSKRVGINTWKKDGGKRNREEKPQNTKIPDGRNP